MGSIRGCDRCFKGFGPDDEVNDVQVVVNGHDFTMELCHDCKEVILHSLKVRKRSNKDE